MRLNNLFWWLGSTSHHGAELLVVDPPILMIKIVSAPKQLWESFKLFELSE